MTTVPAQSTRRRTIIIATLAIGSAFLSNYGPNYIKISAFSQDIMPALFFGGVLAFGIKRWTENSFFDTIPAIALVIVAWIAAVNTASGLYDVINELGIKASEADNGSYVKPPFILAVCGAAGGFVGSALTICGVSFPVRSLRSLRHWTRTIFIGTVAGTLLECWAGTTFYSSGQILPIHVNSVLPLFIVWQPVVAASLAKGMTRDS